MERNMTCILCPRGCAMTVRGEVGGLQVVGNSCPKGQEYAVNECTNPVRTVTSTVRVNNRKDTMVSVKTAAPVPKEKMMEVMEVLARVRVEEPVRIGDTIVEDILGTGVKVVATANT